MNYERDTAKATEKCHKHGIDFVDAIPAIEDPNRIEELDVRFAYREERTQVIGMAPTVSCS